MSSIASGEGREKKVYAAEAQDKAQRRSTCSFCWFVLALYPTLQGMTPRDSATFREHLTAAHGLSQEITA